MGGRCDANVYYYMDGTTEKSSVDCFPPAEPALSEAIVTVIVFVSLVAVAGAAGAYGVCRGAASRM